MITTKHLSNILIMESQMTGTVTKVLKTVSKKSSVLLLCRILMFNNVMLFLCAAGVQTQNHRSSYFQNKCIPKFFNELQILINRKLIISSRDSVCILHL